MINETAAEMVSRELGPRAARELGLESPPAVGGASVDAAALDRCSFGR